MLRVRRALLRHPPSRPPRSLLTAHRSLPPCPRPRGAQTTSSSRIFIKILFQELAEYMGLAALLERLTDPYMAATFAGIFPRDNLRHTRFSINFFTSIGLGALTDDLRAFLKERSAANAALVAAEAAGM